MAKQGEKYRVLSPREVWRRQNPGKAYRPARIVGQDSAAAECYTVRKNGQVYKDFYGDVITASVYVAYPHGKDDTYRNARYIEHNKERFELLQDEN